ncbi:MAG TPA: hypothetical protein VGF76_06150, partial [Polyangiaceae bacterium]
MTDVFAVGARLGRGVLVAGDHASRDELPVSFAANPLHISGASMLSVPFELPVFTLNRATIRVVNAVIQQI